MKSNPQKIGFRSAGAGGFKNNEGFTLIEILMAISILAVGMLAIASLQLSAIKVNSSANYLTSRSTWAQNKLEDLSALPYSNTKLDIGDHGPETTSDGHTIQWNVIGGLVSGTKKVTVTVEKYGNTVQMIFLKADKES